MGNFYTNITILGADGRRTAAALSALGRRAYVADLGDSSVVYDRECEDQDTEILAALAEHLAVELDTRTFAVLNHDDDVLWFQLYDRSELVTEYGNVLGAPKASARRLCAAFDRAGSVARVWIALRRPYVFQVGRHDRLATLLGLPTASVGSGYKYIRNGELPVGLDGDRLTEVGDGD